MRITVRLKIPNIGKGEALLCYQARFSKCVSWWLTKCEEAQTTGRGKLHKLYYRKATAAFPDLQSNSIVAAQDKAIEAYRSYCRKKGEKAFPRNGKMACFKAPQYRFTDKCLILHLKNISLNLPYHVAPRYKDMLDLKHGRGDLVKANGHWYFHVPVEIPSPEPILPQGVIGIDLGLAKLVALSNATFVRGEQARFIRNHYTQKRAELQKKKANGSPNAYKVLKRLSGREKRWMRDLNHKISRLIVNLAQNTNSALAMENLEGIRRRIKAPKKVRRMLHSWPFRQLRVFIEYKSQLAGVPCVTVDPKHTSTRCSRCGHEAKGNRKRQCEFLCKSCGYHLNADLNAARNIALLGSLSLGYILREEGCLASAPM